MARIKGFIIGLLFLVICSVIGYLKYEPLQIARENYRIKVLTDPISDRKISMDTQSQIIDVIVRRIMLEDAYKPYLLRDDFQEIVEVFKELQGDFETVIREYDKSKATNISFNTENHTAIDIRHDFPSFRPGYSLIIMKYGMSFIHSDTDSYWSVIFNPALYRALNRINQSRKIDLIRIEGEMGETEVVLETYSDSRLYFDGYTVKYLYCEDEQNVFYTYGIRLADHWSLDIYTPEENWYGPFKPETSIPIHEADISGLKFYSPHIPAEPDPDRQSYYFQEEIDKIEERRQEEDYKTIVDIFQKNKNYLNYIIGAKISTPYYFLGEDWKKQLEYVPNSDFLSDYSNYYFLEGELEGDLYQQVDQDTQLKNILNKLGKEGEFRYIYNFDGCVAVRLSETFFDIDIAEFYYLKDLDESEKKKYIDDVGIDKIEGDWYVKF